MAETDVADTLLERMRRALFRPRVLMSVALLVCSTVVVPMIAGWLPDLSRRSEYRFRTRAIQISAPPESVPDDLLEQVIHQAGLPEEMSVLDEDLAAVIAEAFARHPWIKQVVRVRKFAPAGVHVELKYREPVAMVEVQQGLYPVDAEGILLPPEDFSVAEARRFPIIKNVQVPPQGPAGTNWGDAGVAGAARLAERLGSHWEEFHLAAILIVPRQKAADSIADIQYELLTGGGSRILWGRAPATGHPGELTADQKIGRLMKYLADFRGFDRPHGPYEIDIRRWGEISRRPLRPGSSPMPRRAARADRRR